jgi:hypothetical protein
MQRVVIAFLEMPGMQRQTSRAALAVLFLSMGLLPLGGCGSWGPPPPIPIAATFVGHIKADRYQEAYDMTSPAFRACFTKNQFEQFCKRRDLPRARPEFLVPNRSKYPYTGGELGIYDTRILPFSITIGKGEEGHWLVEDMILQVMDEKKLQEIADRPDAIK